MKKLIVILFVLSPLFSFSQDGLGLWAGIGVNKKLTKKFSLDLKAQSRIVDNFSYTQSYLAEAGLSYKLRKHWNVAGYYRFISKRKNETSNFKNRHRFYADLSYDNKIGAIKFENRVRYQYQFKDNDGEIGFDKSYIREKIEIAYPNKSNFTPYLSGDLFYEIGGKIDQLRPKIGTSYKINKHHSLDASVFTNINLTETEKASPIISLSYKFKF